MGCCWCRSKVHITEDPSVRAYTTVGPTGLIYSFEGDVLSRCCSYDGMMYVKGNRLCYENSFGPETLCCGCSRRSWKLSGIQKIALIQNENVLVQMGNFFYTIPLNPGLKIEIVNSFGLPFTMCVSMPDAENFHTQLKQILAEASTQAKI